MSNGIEIIGLSGKAGAGKDYIGREVLRPAGYRQWAFAWPLKHEVVGRGWATYTDVHHDKPADVRRMLQTVGTEDGWKKWGRSYWLNHAGAWLRLLHEEWGVTRFYLTDVRFPHEVDWIRAHGGKVVRIQHGTRPYPLVGQPASAHESETALDSYIDWDAEIWNGLDRTADGIRQEFWAKGLLPREG